MKGIIVYSSRTGNTKRLAEHIYATLKDIVELDIRPVEEAEKLEEYDFALVGAWVDRGWPNKKILQLIKETQQNRLGIFVTLGAMPDSPHGQKVRDNLEKLLEGKESLGQVRLPGLVDPKTLSGLEGLTGKVVPREIRDKMIDTGKKSRRASLEELEEAGAYFKEKIQKMKDYERGRE